MTMTRKTAVIIGALLLGISATAFAFTRPPRVSWIPEELKPASIAPGSSASYTLTLKHTGILPIPATNQLRIVAEGDIIAFITITQPSFPPVFKRGNQVTVTRTVT
jgi:hypothetical protein